MPASDYDLELVELHRQSVGKLLAIEVFDKEAFDRLKTYLCQKAELIKKEHVISKQVVLLILEVMSVIESRAPYVSAANDHQHMINEFFMLLGLMASGEGCDDRKPGVPRVV